MNINLEEFRRLLLFLKIIISKSHPKVHRMTLFYVTKTDLEDRIDYKNLFRNSIRNLNNFEN